MALTPLDHTLPKFYLPYMLYLAKLWNLRLDCLWFRGLALSCLLGRRVRWEVNITMEPGDMDVLVSDPLLARILRSAFSILCRHDPCCHHGWF